ncbi:MAG: hypothetical protein GX817_04830 [Elusimicrobia bacterium]|nr:hypothetical protein [Elusimicrobiota bacterium]
MSTKTHKVFRFVFIFFLLYWIVSTIYWGIDNFSISGQDTPNHLLFSLEFYRALLSSLSKGGLKIFEMVGLLFKPMPHSAGRYTNLTYLITAPYYHIFGSNLAAARLSNIPALALLIISVYFISKEFAGKSAGMLSVLFLLFNPLIFESSRQYGVDLFLAAFAGLSVLLLIRFEGFIGPKAIIWGLVSGIGIFFKPYIMIYLGPPALVYLFFNIKNSEDKKRVVLHFISASLVILFFILVWLFKNFPSFKWYAAGKNQVKYLPYFFRSFLLSTAGWTALIFFIPGLKKIIKDNKPSGYTILLWVGVPLILLAWLFGFKWHTDRYFLSMVPAIAVASAVGAFSFKRKIRIPLIAFSLLYLSGQYTYLTFSSGEDCKNIDEMEYQDYFKFQKYGLINPSSYTVGYAKGDPSGLKEVIDFINQDCSEANNQEIIGVSLVCQGPKPFEVRYRFSAVSPIYDYLDYSQMPHSTHSVLKYCSPNYLIFKLKSASIEDLIPDYTSFTERVKESMILANRLMYMYAVREDIREEKFHLFSNLYETTELVKEIEACEISWRIYKVKEEEE